VRSGGRERRRPEWIVYSGALAAWAVTGGTTGDEGGSVGLGEASAAAAAE
jgi:hypothetical protein